MAGVPIAVYVVYMVLMGVGACSAFLLLPTSKVVRDDGTQVASIKARGFLDELRSNLEIFRDWKLLLMVTETYKKTDENFFFFLIALHVIC